MFCAFEGRGPLRYFPSVTTVSGRQAQIRLDDGQSVDVTPAISADGLTVEMNITATVKGFQADDKTPLRKRSATATIRDCQAVILGEAVKRTELRQPIRERARLILVRAMITDPAGKPLHFWEERDNETRF